MVTVPNQTIVPPIVPGQAPGNNQVDLNSMRSGLASVLTPGMLGNNVANPMTPIIAQGGDAGLQYQNDIANSRMQDVALQAQQQALQQAEQQYKLQQQQPRLTDFLGLGLSGLSAAQGAGLFNGSPQFNLQSSLDTSQPNWSQFNG